MSRPKTIALMLEATRQYVRDVLLGIARYARETPDWKLRVEPSRPAGGLTLDEAIGTDGVVLFVDRRRDLESLQAAGTPFVNLGSKVAGPDVPHVSNDGLAMAELAIEHFVQRGLRSLAFCELDQHSHIRSCRFEEEGARRDLPFDVFRVDYANRRKWVHEADAPEIDAWIDGLPKPVGIVAHNDIRGRHVINSCRRLGLEVPHDVAVLGIDNEIPHCELCDPPLSSIVTAAEQIGFMAAQLLDQLVDGEAPERTRILVPPSGLVTRQSTELLATEDELVARAVRFIRDRAATGIDVGDVVLHCDVSRTTLDNRFRKVVGHSPHEEIVRLRLERARELLRETTLTQEEIAIRTGFRHAEYLGFVFRRRYAETPGEFRRKHARRSG